MNVERFRAPLLFFDERFDVAFQLIGQIEPLPLLPRILKFTMNRGF
jgi:hypothetical protein